MVPHQPTLFDNQSAGPERPLHHRREPLGMRERSKGWSHASRAARIEGRTAGRSPRNDPDTYATAGAELGAYRSHGCFARNAPTPDHLGSTNWVTDVQGEGYEHFTYTPYQAVEELIARVFWCDVLTLSET